MMNSQAGSTVQDTKKDSEHEAKRARLDTEGSTKAGVVAQPSQKWNINPKFLQDMLAFKIQRFYSAGDIVFVAERDNKVVDVWKGLVQHNFLAVPVLSKTEHHYYGVITLSDIVRELVKRFAKEQLRQERSFWERIDESKAFGEVKVNDIMQYPRTKANQFHPVSAGYSLLYAVELMAREHELHRVPVINAKFELVNLVTQSRVVEYLAQHVHELGDKARKPLSACRELLKPVLSVGLDTIALDAFERMVEKEVYGLAVLDGGKLVDTLSMRDIKVVGASLAQFWRFYQPLSMYLSELKAETKIPRNPAVVAVTTDKTLGDVIENLALNRIHRVFIVDSMQSMKPIGIVTLRDVLLEIITPE